MGISSLPHVRLKSCIILLHSLSLSLSFASVVSMLQFFSGHRRHYHSMEVFATFDIINEKGEKVAEGHKASFCLEDNLCKEGVEPRYACANYGDQGCQIPISFDESIFHDIFDFFSFSLFFLVCYPMKRYFCWLL